MPDEEALSQALPLRTHLPSKPPAWACQEACNPTRCYNCYPADMTHSYGTAATESFWNLGLPKKVLQIVPDAEQSSAQSDTMLAQIHSQAEIETSWAELFPMV